jgi:hypothetical protein
MTASVTFFNTARLYIGDSTFGALASDTWKVTLHNSTFAPSASTMSVGANLTNELATANGYTAGGLALASVAWTQTTTTVAFSAANSVWTASGGSIVARYAVIRAVGTLNGHVDPLLLWYLLDTTPADVTTTTGNTLTIAYAAAGIFVLS